MKFYLVAMLFILFDVEAVFLYPWAVILRDLKMFGFWEMLVYIGIVLVGFFYVWKKGVMDWGKHVSADEVKSRCPWLPPITDLEQLKIHPAVAQLAGVECRRRYEGAKFDRDEMTIYVERAHIREACACCEDDPDCPFQLPFRRHLCGLVSVRAAV